MTAEISVVIPAFNQATFLGAAIESVLAQTRPAKEIIVVDDGSTDATPEVARRYGDRIGYIRQDNAGLSAARNTGIQAAMGDYVALLDSDDLWLPRFLELTGRLLDSRPDLGAVYAGLQFVDAHGIPLHQQVTRTVAPEALHDALIDGEFFAADAVLVRRACFDRVGLFNPALRASEDWDMWLRVARAYAFAGLSEPLLLYRMHGENMSADPSRMLRYQRMVVASHFGPDTGDPANWPQDRRRAYATVWRQAALAYLGRGDGHAAAAALARALAVRPALVSDSALFYELGCARQPLGRRGDLTTLDLDTSASDLLALVDDGLPAVTEPRLGAGLRRTARAQARLALARLALGADHRSLARHFAMRAAATDPTHVFRRPWWALLGRTALNERSRRRLRALIHRTGAGSTSGVST